MSTSKIGQGLRLECDSTCSEGAKLSDRSSYATAAMLFGKQQWGLPLYIL